jgi:hypothetical protein
MLVFSPIPLGNSRARHMRSIHYPRHTMRSDQLLAVCIERSSNVFWTKSAGF